MKLKYVIVLHTMALSPEQFEKVEGGNSAFEKTLAFGVVVR